VLYCDNINLINLVEATLRSSIEYLKKVGLAVLAGSESGKYSLTPSPVSFEFLYGIGGDGLTPFEAALGAKQQGDTLTLTVAADDAAQFFGHFLPPLRQSLGLHLLPATICLHLRVTAVTDAENREVVQALAKVAGHGGCGGSCGCGCG
jgi:hypothetical protein